MGRIDSSGGANQQTNIEVVLDCFILREVANCFPLIRTVYSDILHNFKKNLAPLSPRVHDNFIESLSYQRADSKNVFPDIRLNATKLNTTIYGALKKLDLLSGDKTNGTPSKNQSQLAINIASSKTKPTKYFDLFHGSDILSESWVVDEAAIQQIVAGLVRCDVLGIDLRLPFLQKSRGECLFVEEDEI